MNIKGSVLLLIGCLLLAACSQPEPAPTATSVLEGTPTPLRQPPGTVEPVPSQDLFLRPTVVTRIVTEEPADSGDERRHSCLGPTVDIKPSVAWELGPDNLSPSQFEDYLAQIGVAEICLPLEIGAPFLGVDWNAAAEPPTADAGRRIRITFDGIDRLSLIFATYDFAAGSEYVSHATRADYETSRSGTHDRSIVTNGTPGFLFIDDVNGMVEKAYVYPFANHYIAITYRLGEGADGDQRAELEQAVVHPPYPPSIARKLDIFDELMSSLRLIEITPPHITADAG